MNSNETPKSEHQTDYQMFREEKHKLFSTPQETISEAIEKATGSRILEQNRIIAGETNEVQFVKTESGRELIIRIYHGDKPKFDREKWAIEQCAKAGVPVPEVLLVEDKEVDNKPIQICVETKIEGEGLDNVGRTEDSNVTDNLRNLLGKLGSVLEKIHSIPTKGFGSLDKSGKGKYVSAKDLILNDQFISGENILPEDQTIQFDREIVRKAKEVLEKEAVNFSEIESHLIHGDLAPQHVMINGGEISGIIDFEHARGSDPAEEFARWELKFGDRYPIYDIKHGFSDKAVFSGDFEKRKNIWRLYQGLAILSYCIREKKQFGVDKAVKGLAESLSRFG